MSDAPDIHLDPDADLAARIAAATALRNFAHAFVTYDAPIAAIQQAGTWATAQTELWSHGVRRDRLAMMHAARARAIAQGNANAGMMTGGAGFEDRAVAGKANPSGVDIQVREFGEVCSVDVIFHKANEGPPGRAHGGIVSAVFDDVTGYIIGSLAKPAFTGELTVRLVAPVPLDTPLLFRTWLDREDGRKLHIHAEALDGDHVVATCKAIYITVDPSLFGTSADI